MPLPLVSVIIPAFNAQTTLDATLNSARAQTHGELEIIVIDDGSDDETAALAHEHARSDSRIRLVRQENGGVARARNRGIAEAAGDFIAPLDADDLWHPLKIERQLAELRAKGDDYALAYSWFHRTDLAGGLVGTSPHPCVQGNVLFRHIDWNFISNGSSPLIRARVAKEIGYDPALHDAGFQGCEDYLFQLRIAQRFRFACAPGFLIGYRVVPGAMSQDPYRMICSHIMAYSRLRCEMSDERARALIDRRIATLRIELARNRLRRAALRTALDEVAQAVALDFFGAWEGLRSELRRFFGRSSNEHVRDKRSLFLESDPDHIIGTWRTRRTARWLTRLASLDGATR